MSIIFLRVFAGFLAGLLLGIVIMRRATKKTQAAGLADTPSISPTVSSTTSH